MSEINNAEGSNKANLQELLKKLHDDHVKSAEPEGPHIPNIGIMSIWNAIINYDPDAFVSCGDGTVTSKYFKEGVVIGSKFAKNDNTKVGDNAFKMGLYINALSQLHDPVDLSNMRISAAQELWFSRRIPNCSIEFMRTLVDVPYYYSSDNPIRKKIKEALNNYVATAPTYGLEWNDKIIDKAEKRIYNQVRNSMLRVLAPAFFTGFATVEIYKHYVEEIFGVTDPTVLDIIAYGLYNRYGNNHHRKYKYHDAYKREYEYHRYNEEYDRSLSWVLNTEGFYYNALHNDEMHVYFGFNGSRVGLYKTVPGYTLSNMVVAHTIWNTVSDDFSLELENKLSKVEDISIIRGPYERDYNRCVDDKKQYLEPMIFADICYKRDGWVKKTNNWLNAIKPGGSVEQLADVLPFDARLFLKTVRQFIEDTFGLDTYAGVKDPDTAIMIKYKWLEYCDQNGYDSNYFGFKPVRTFKGLVPV